MVKIRIKKNRRKNNKKRKRYFVRLVLCVSLLITVFLLVTREEDTEALTDHNFGNYLHFDDGQVSPVSPSRKNAIVSKRFIQARSKLLNKLENGRSRKHHKRNKKIMQKLPHHCPEARTRREIVIKGERHTGTNWIRGIIRENVSSQSVKIEQDSNDFGWKHGFLPPEGWGKPISNDEVLVVITRDVFTWLPKMVSESYDPFMNRKRHEGFSRFIRGKYGGFCQPIDKRLRSSIQKQFCAKFKRTFFGLLDLEDFPAETADNLIKIRNQKYKQWLSDDPADGTYLGSKDSFLKNRIHVRLESMVDGQIDSGISAKDQRQLIGDPLLDRCIPTAENFREVTDYTKWLGRKKNKTFNAHEEKNMLLENYSKEDLRFVLSQLDLEFENRIGYDYSYVYEMLNEDAGTS
jgi:hypothetical protein